MIRRPPRSTQSRSSAASDVYKRQHLEQALGAGAVSYSWDGKDGLGNDVPAFRRVKVKVSVNRTAEIHFGSDDLEHRGGVKNYLMNAPAGTSAADRYKIYWDDTDLSDNDPLGNPLMVTATKLSLIHI